MSDLWAPEGGWRVRILDMSGGAEDGIVEEIKGFPTIMQANAFARAYVRDSVELCRSAGMASRDVLAAWFAFGEDAEVLDAPEDGWRSANACRISPIGRLRVRSGTGGRWTLGGRSSASFLKKRSKKLLLFEVYGLTGTRPKVPKFFAAFFQESSSFLPPKAPQCASASPPAQPATCMSAMPA